MSLWPTPLVGRAFPLIQGRAVRPEAHLPLRPPRRRSPPLRKPHLRPTQQTRHGTKPAPAIFLAAQRYWNYQLISASAARGINAGLFIPLLGYDPFVIVGFLVPVGALVTEGFFVFHFDLVSVFGLLMFATIFGGW